MNDRLTTIQREVMSQIRLSWAFGLALYFSFHFTTSLFLSTYYYYLEKCIGGLRVVGNGCIEQGSGRLDALFYFFHFIFPCGSFFAYERAYRGV